MDRSIRLAPGAFIADDGRRQALSALRHLRVRTATQADKNVILTLHVEVWIMREMGISNQFPFRPAYRCRGIRGSSQPLLSPRSLSRNLSSVCIRATPGSLLTDRSNRLAPKSLTY